MSPPPPQFCDIKSLAKKFQTINKSSQIALFLKIQKILNLFAKKNDKVC